MFLDVLQKINDPAHFHAFYSKTKSLTKIDFKNIMTETMDSLTYALDHACLVLERETEPVRSPRRCFSNMSHNHISIYKKKNEVANSFVLLWDHIDPKYGPFQL